MKLYRALRNIIWIKSVLNWSVQYEYNLNLWLFRSAFLVFWEQKVLWKQHRCYDYRVWHRSEELGKFIEKTSPTWKKIMLCNCNVIILEWLQMTLFLTSTKMKWSYTSKTGHGPSKNNRREKLTFDGYILLKNHVGWSLEIKIIKLQITISEKFVCKTYLLTGF